MPRADFYVLSTGGDSARPHFACRIAEKAFEQGQTIYLHTASSGDSQQLDELLWTFRDGSFLPHEVFDGQSDIHSRVLILVGHGPGPVSHQQTLVNLTSDFVPDCERYERVIEIVPTDPEHKRLARERFKQYRERGYALETHNI
jgi:DNA polymerase-3 subunit chi